MRASAAPAISCALVSPSASPCRPTGPLHRLHLPRTTLLQGSAHLRHRQLQCWGSLHHTHGHLQMHPGTACFRCCCAAAVRLHHMLRSALVWLPCCRCTQWARHRRRHLPLLPAGAGAGGRVWCSNCVCVRDGERGAARTHDRHPAGEPISCCTCTWCKPLPVTVHPWLQSGTEGLQVSAKSAAIAATRRTACPLVPPAGRAPATLGCCWRWRW